MKKLTLVLVFFLFVNLVFSQSEVGNIAFSLVMPEEIDGFDQNNLSKLESKIIQATSNIGIAGKGFYSDFILYPTISFNEGVSHNQSMKNTFSINIELGLYIKSVADGRIFSSYSKNLVGIGSNKNTALNNALNDFDTKEQDLKDFYINSSKKIVNYFESKCQDFISKADSYSKMGKYDEAIALLLSIPNISTNCFNKVKDKSIEVYKLHVNKTCNSLIINAKSFKTIGDIKSAVKTLCLIESTSECFKEAIELLNSIEKELNNKEKEEFQRSLKFYENESELEKLRITAMKEIAIANYNSKPTSYNYYDVIIKR